MPPTRKRRHVDAGASTRNRRHVDAGASTPPRSTSATPAGTPSTEPRPARRPSAADRVRAHAARWLEAEDEDGNAGSSSDDDDAVSDGSSGFIVDDDDDDGAVSDSQGAPPARLAAIADSQPSLPGALDDVDAHAAYVAAALEAVADPGGRPAPPTRAGRAVAAVEGALHRARELAVASQAWRKADPRLLVALEALPRARCAPAAAGRGATAAACQACGRGHAAAPRSTLTLSGDAGDPFWLGAPPRRLAEVDGGVRAALAAAPARPPAGGTWQLGDTCAARLLLYHALLWYGQRVRDAAATKLAAAARGGAPTPAAALDAALNDAGLACTLYRDYAALVAAADACLGLHAGDDDGGRGGAAARAAAFHSRVARAVAAFEEPRYGSTARSRAEPSQWWVPGGRVTAVVMVDAATQTDGGGGGGDGRRVVIETDSE